ncbi:hypothetical protein RN001_000083 [Aquatica leii]|uniref:Tesmin/TSO1-like CXC domain-containing protein n=1 Tax=Aquatica leii TaxID=1421715 RepID=A0AAN7PEE0_9COLE|nr:hypothetical protein RN001_000083 [Aquatica leii]
MFLARTTPHYNHLAYFLKPAAVASKQDKVFDICKIQGTIDEIKHWMLFLHAMTGCDLTSALFRKGKRSAYKILAEDKNLRKEISIFNCLNSDPFMISSVGEKFLLRLYREKQCKTLNDLRYVTFQKTITRQKVTASFELAALPPTSDAARLHSFRVYLQPINWGWREASDMLIPVPSTIPLAPNELLHLITCNCKTDCIRGCNCRKADLTCFQLCGRCRGTACKNHALEEEGSEDKEKKQ